MSNYGNFIGQSAAKLTSTSSNQTITLPSGNGSGVVYNGAANTVYISMIGAASVPTGAFTAGLTAVPPGCTIGFSVPIGGGTLQYICDGTGGEFVVNLGEGN